MSSRGIILPPQDVEALAIGDLYRKGRSSMMDSVRYLIEAGQRLIEKKNGLGHGEWLPWLEANADALGFETPRTAQRLMGLAEKASSTSHLDEETAVRLSREVWGNSQPALYSSESFEWYTPQRYLVAVREVLGGIDLDPASNAQANAIVKATSFFTKEDDGLSRDWRGRVFMNPPYGKTEDGNSLASMFCTKALAEYDFGNIESAIILVNSLHSQAWQAPLYTQPICLVDHRIQFISGNGEENKNPTFQNIFVYLGPDERKFANVFSRLGYVMQPVLRAAAHPSPMDDGIPEFLRRAPKADASS
jgi:hypothetical protein